MIPAEKIIENNSLLKSLMKRKNNHQIGTHHNFDKVENHREINKEIIRRLRIQNRKLIEHLTRLKEETKRAKNNKIKVRNHIYELLKLIENI